MLEYKLDVAVYARGGASGLVAETTITLPFAPQCESILHLWGGVVDDMGIEIQAYNLDTGHFYGIACDIFTEYDTKDLFRSAFDEPGWTVKNA